MIVTNVQFQTPVCLYLIMILISQTMAFMPMFTNSIKHQDITRDAILQTTADVCKQQALNKGRNFVLKLPMNVNSVAEACSSSQSAKHFQRSIDEISHHNAWVDFWKFFTPSYHFCNEEILAGRDIITAGVSAAKYSVKMGRYETARERLGKILHPLQDFYSHSNWIEMGKRKPYPNLIKPHTPINNIADSETCRKCTSRICRGNILEDVLKKQKLTTAYFGWSKPRGKCSHGGRSDPSSWFQGGINKDTDDSDHGYLHYEAASVATAATRELLQDIRAATGDSEFLRLMGFRQTSVLCFVVDTTGSMSDEINEIRRVYSSIIDSKVGTAVQPSEYILVPFNDPDYGPLTRTSDPNVFKKKLNALRAHDGGDVPEMCFSGLQLALTGSPPQTQIFVFTDADAKDKWLASTVKALIEKTKSVVNFMLTPQPSRLHKRASTGLSTQLNEVYYDLAQDSGGQAIEVTKETLSQATSIIADISSSTLVTLFQAVRKTVDTENFSVFVDSSVQNLTIYITGNSPDYTITSPSGVSQSSTELNGMLGLIQRVGNFHTVRPNIAEQVGLWLFSIKSKQMYTIKVVGQSAVDFMFDFVELSQGLHPSYSVLNSRPANSNVTLLVSMVGGDSVSLTEVSLVKASSSISLNGSLEEVASGQYLVTFNSIPAREFTVRVFGQISVSRYSANTFQRQSPTQFQASTVTITTQPVETMEPGKQFTLPFTLATNGTAGSFNIRVSNDHNFETQFNRSITLESGVSVNDTVTLTVPKNTSSGTDVTVTIEAEAVDGSDSNYAVLHIAIIAPMTDFTPPLCEAVSVNANCSGNCSLSSWHLTANVTDGNGSGIQSVRILQGNGNLTTTTVFSDTGVNVTMVTYNASCCSQDLELVAVDKAGNVASCFNFVRATELSTSTAPAITATTTTNTTTIPTNTTTTSMSRPTIQTGTNSVECCLILPVFLWLNVVVSVYQFM